MPCISWLRNCMRNVVVTGLGRLNHRVLHSEVRRLVVGVTSRAIACIAASARKLRCAVR